MHYTGIACGVVCGVALAVPVSGAIADLIVFEFSGIVTSSDPTSSAPGPAPGVDVGDMFSGHFVFDTSALLTPSDDFNAIGDTVVADFLVNFFAAGTGSLISSWDFSPHNGDPTSFADHFSIRNDHPTAVFDDLLEFQDREVLNGQDAIYTFVLGDSSGTAFDSLAIPEALNLEDFDILSSAGPGRYFQLQSMTDSWIIRGEITELAVVPPDSDGDGVPDDADCQPDSDLSETVVIDGCDSDVENVLFGDGCTIRDLIAECVDGANTHGQFMSCVAQLTKDLKQQGIISGQEKGAIQSCAAQAFFCPSP